MLECFGQSHAGGMRTGQSKTLALSLRKFLFIKNESKKTYAHNNSTLDIEMNIIKANKDLKRSQFLKIIELYRILLYLYIERESSISRSIVRSSITWLL